MPFLWLIRYRRWVPWSIPRLTLLLLSVPQFCRANSVKDAVRPPWSFFWLICWWKVVLAMPGLDRSANNIIGGNINFYFPLHGAPTSAVFCRYSLLALNFLILVIMFLGCIGRNGEVSLALHLDH